jgi:transcription elongation factor GreA
MGGETRPIHFQERNKMDEFIPMTQEGYQRLQEELKRLIRVERPNAVQAIAEARGHGDLSENAEYEAAKEHQSFVEGRIKELSAKIAHAQVINPAEYKNSDKVVFGAKVTLFDVQSDNEVTYQLVGEDEADLKDGKISVTSPVGRALIGHFLDDEVHIEVPSGTRIYEVVNICYE